MIKVEITNEIADIDVKGNSVAQILAEWAYVTAAVLNMVPKKDLDIMYKKAQERAQAFKKINDAQSKLFTRRLAHLMELKGIKSKKELQAVAGISNDDLAYIEIGQLPSREGCERLTKFFDVKPDYFFDE